MSRPAVPFPSLLLAVLLAAPLLGGCNAFYKRVQPQWVEGEVQTRSEKVLYDATLISLRKAGYPVGMGADSGARQVASGWYRSLSPFKGRGYRQKATVRYENTSEDRFMVLVRVQRENNDSFRPLDPTMAKWKETEDSVQDARIVLQYIQSNVGVPPLEVGEERRPGGTP